MEHDVVVDGLPGPVLNLARSGYTTVDVLKGLASLAPPPRLNTVVVAGKNDYAADPIGAELKELVGKRMAALRHLLGAKTRVFVVGIGAKACEHSPPRAPAPAAATPPSKRRRRQSRVSSSCCERMRRRVWTESYNEALSSLALSVGYCYVPPPSDMEDWAWQDAIHLDAREHPRYVAHISEAMA